jgi:hypothetical protein
MSKYSLAAYPQAQVASIFAVRQSTCQRLFISFLFLLLFFVVPDVWAQKTVLTYPANASKDRPSMLVDIPVSDVNNGQERFAAFFASSVSIYSKDSARLIRTVPASRFTIGISGNGSDLITAIPDDEGNTKYFFLKRSHPNFEVISETLLITVPLLVNGPNRAYAQFNARGFTVHDEHGDLHIFYGDGGALEHFAVPDVKAVATYGSFVSFISSAGGDTVKTCHINPSYILTCAISSSKEQLSCSNIKMNEKYVFAHCNNDTLARYSYRAGDSTLKAQIELNEKIQIPLLRGSKVVNLSGEGHRILVERDARYEWIDVNSGKLARLPANPFSNKILGLPMVLREEKLITLDYSGFSYFHKGQWRKLPDNSTILDVLALEVNTEQSIVNFSTDVNNFVLSSDGELTIVPSVEGNFVQVGSAGNMAHHCSIQAEALEYGKSRVINFLLAFEVAEKPRIVARVRFEGDRSDKTYIQDVTTVR